MFFAFFVAPSRWILPLSGITCAVVGIWAILYPESVLGWAKTAHPQLDVDDRSLWWVPRLIGAVFLFVATTVALISLGRQR
jgi:hypothetical protein